MQKIFFIVLFIIFIYCLHIHNKNMVNVFSIKGKRDYMEDTYIIHSDSIYSIYGVFDGHGGKNVSDALKKILPVYFSRHVFNSTIKYNNVNEISNKIKKSFLILDHIIKNNVNSYSVGSTASIIIKYNNLLITVNLGDSRAVILQKNVENSNGMILFATTDHKPEHERERIKKSKGDVKFDGHVYRVNGNLSLSRAFGDFYLKYYSKNKYRGPVSVEPEINFIQMNKNTKYIGIIGSDGLWDDVSNRDVLNIYRHCKKNKVPKISSVLGATAYKKGSSDNITVMYVEL
jgi:serine/threonine protein phosphatase PrpC